MCLAAIAAGALGWFLGHIRVVVWPVVVAFAALVLFNKTLKRRAAFKALNGLRDIGFRVCPWCSYDLRSLEHDGECPECGEPFQEEALAREWRERLEPAVRGF